MSSVVDPIEVAAVPEWRPRFNPWAIAMTVTLATFMEVLDTSIANVALPHIAGNLSISQDEAAKRAGFANRQVWNDLEKGRRPNPTLQNIESIAAALGRQD